MNEALLQRLATLEGESAVRRLMACYMDLCDVPRAAIHQSQLAQLFTEDAIWEGLGTQTASIVNNCASSLTSTGARGTSHRSM